MKKSISILLALAMILALAACGGGQSSAPTPKAEAAPEATAAPAPPAEPEAVEEAVEAAEEAIEASAEAAAEAVEETAEEAELSAEEALGDKQGNVYVNKALEITATLPGSWYVLSDEEIAGAMGYVMEQVTDEEMAALLEDSGVICDFYASSTDGSGDTLNLMLQHLKGMQGLLLSEEAIAEASVEPTKQTMESMGMTDVQVSRGTTVFAGKEHASIDVVSYYSGVAIYERVVLVKVGSYVGSITSGSADKGRAETNLDFFKAS